MNLEPLIKINDKEIGGSNPTYFVADIAANHDGDLNRAKELVYLAAEAGADAAKFQHFRAETIVSDREFKKLGAQLSHQSAWKKSVFQVYQDASVSIDWNVELKKTCDDAGIHFFTTPYDLEIVDQIADDVPAIKIGSGDITWIEMVEKVAKKGKPYLLATGASSMKDVERAVAAGLAINKQLVLMQCNTNYTASLENFKYINLNVLKTYANKFTNVPLGLSDHTPGHATVLGAVALGARVVEKHFTDNCGRDGPDHRFSMDPHTWSEMVKRTRELEFSLGNGLKVIEENEQETAIVQRRSICAKQNLDAGTVLQFQDVIMLRPAPNGALEPYRVNELLGRTLKENKKSGEAIMSEDLE
jgi:N-acetylneuraminate synthase